MLFDRTRPHAFREWRVSPALAQEAAQRALARVERRVARGGGIQAYAVHLAHDRTRVITVEAWAAEADFRRDPDADDTGTGLYRWKATGGAEPTPVDGAGAGVIIIDLFRVWRPVAGPVLAFNIRNGEAFNREPGCLSTTVLRGIGAGAIATYARWRSVEDFAAAFSKLSGRQAADADGVNRQAARMTFGLIRPDYHSYDLVAFSGDIG